MTNENSNTYRSKALRAAARLFLEKGYSNTSTREIAKCADIDISALNRTFRTKENILCDLVKYVLKGQFEVAEKLIAGKTTDKILFYAVETTLQLYMAESSEHVRDLYSNAYSLPKSSDIIQHAITGKLEEIFKEHLPNLETKDFYKLEIASGGIMRGFLTIPCDMWFTMDQKVASFLETTFLVYRVSDEKIKETIEFVSQFDFVKIASDTIAVMLESLESDELIVD